MRLINSEFRKIRIFTITLAILMLISLFVLSWMYHIEKQVASESFNNDIQKHLQNIGGNIEQDLNTVYSDLIFLKEYAELIEDGESVYNNQKKLGELFKLFSKNRKSYDQIRFIDISGDEIVRVNYDNGKCIISDFFELQNKADRYYFQETIKLSENEIYVSPLDLNIENGSIEKPYKAMIRFGIPVKGSDGEVVGMIVTNFYGQILLDDIVDYNSESLGFTLNVELLNEDGFFIKAIEEVNAWGFVFDEIHDQNNLSIQDANLWNDILKTKEYNSILDEKQYYSYQISINRLNDSSYGVKSEKKRWIVLARVPYGVVKKQADVIKLRYIYMFSILTVGYIIIAYLWMIYNTKKQEYNIQLNKLAYHDKLTGLANRSLFMETFEKHLEKLTRYDEISALYFLDLDGFKYINDTYGHDVGDILLKEVARRIEKTMRSSDTIGRIGGDEFIILAIELLSKQEAEKIATRLLEEITKTYIIAGDRMSVGVSIGIAMLPEDGLEHEMLMKKADYAMYEVKNNTKNNFKFYKEND